jgi:tripartite-type tricarboxylate transporter receptor subunit TctC
MTTRRLALLALAAAPVLARAQSAPPLRILVNGTAGSSVDLLCRTLADGLRERLARPVVVDNRSGAGGFASALGARGAPADGSVLVQTNVGVSALSPIVFRRPPMDPDAELAPLCHLTDTPFGLAVKADAPGGGTLRGWLDAVRARGAEIAVNSATGLPRFAVHLMASTTGIALQAVIYRSSGAMLPDLEAGHVPAGLTIGAEFLEQYRAGRLRLLAQSLSEGRWAQIPEVPRFTEQGVDFVGSAWNGLFLPAGVPAPLRAQLAEAVTAVLHQPAVTARLRSLGMEPTGGTPEALRARIEADRARWRPVIAASGFVADEP